MTKIGFWFVVVLGLVGAIFAGVEHLKDMGRGEERERVAVAIDASKLRATAQGLRRVAAMEARRRQASFEARAAEVEAGKLREERSHDANTDVVVFGDDWARWLQLGAGNRPAGSGR